MLLGPGQLVGKLVGVLRLMVASNRDTHDAYELPTRLLSRLVLGHEVFGRQFVEAGGLRDGILPRLLGGENPPGLLIDTLLLVSQLARSKKEHYAHVDGAEIYPQIKVRRFSMQKDTRRDTQRPHSPAVSTSAASHRFHV